MLYLSSMATNLLRKSTRNPRKNSKTALDTIILPQREKSLPPLNSKRKWRRRKSHQNRNLWEKRLL